MRNYLLAAVATAALTSPAFARDDSVYVGVDAGVMLVEDTVLDYEDVFGSVDNAYDVDHKYGFDLGINAGYDFGIIRAEAELAYKQADVDEVQIDGTLTGGLPATLPFDADGDVSVLSIMGNLLLDFGDPDGWSGFIGGGLGWANVDYDVTVPSPIGGVPLIDSSDSDGHLAWQILAGVRKSITPNLDLGLKYRMFTVDDLKFDDDGGAFALGGRYRSHSLLLSLVYNFYTPAPPPPPPPPATQTCPDGSVIPADAACPPPPPPPPPPPEPERGGM